MERAIPGRSRPGRSRQARRKLRRGSLLAIIATLASLPAVALHADGSTPAASTATTVPATLGAQWTPVPAERLEQMRGGFESPSGLLVSFGIERLVHVNGQLVASARLTIADGQVDGDLAAFNQTLLVQVGEGNRFEPTRLGGVVIQNTLDNQDIRVSTRIDTQVGTLGVFQAIQQQDALQGALAGAVLP
jgi:hypothetical protein